MYSYLNMHTLFVVLSTLAHAVSSTAMNFTIDKTWNGESIGTSEQVQLSLNQLDTYDGLSWTVKATYYGDPAPNGTRGQPRLGLWDYEVSEIFFANDDNQYLEVEMGPHGQHIVLFMNGERNVIKHSLPLDMDTEMTNNIWTGRATIPSDFFHPKVTRFNAYHIHGVGEDRRYLALYPTDGTTQEPDFHKLSFFKPINMSQFSSVRNTVLSRIWGEAISTKKIQNN